ncbi:MAG: oxidoreductase [Rhodospirillaceae bacterium]|jgi:Fe-S-cluster-containing dehydrogenase component|nr:oxidoreductase [Rhodospirillaceae bacterium]
MKKWNLIIDVGRCMNCNLCTLACQDEYVGNSFPGYSAEMPKHGHRWINIHRKERGQAPMVDVAYLPTMCNHCDVPHCLKAAKNGAVRKRDDGIVIIDPEKAKGQRQLVEACPYNHIWWNEEEQVPQHWIFDAHLLDQGWTKTRGSQACPTGAMWTAHLDEADIARLAEKEGLEVLHPEYGTRPRVYYKNLARFTKCFIGGSLAAEMRGVAECIEGARVSLLKGGSEIAEAGSDNYGDFKFDGLDKNSGKYRIEIRATDFRSKTLDVELGESAYLGVIDLKPVSP